MAKLGMAALFAVFVAGAAFLAFFFFEPRTVALGEKTDGMPDKADEAMTPPNSGQEPAGKEPRPSVGRRLLPDLVLTRPNELYIADSEKTGRREIRFSTIVLNRGAGALELFGTYDPARQATAVFQRIFRDDGTNEVRPAGEFRYHTDHEHWHFEDFTVFELWTYRPDGSLETLMGTTGKISFCIRDSRPILSSAPRGYGKCENNVQGITAGWDDIYEAKVPRQQLELTGIPDGLYAIRYLVDPDDRILEESENNNFLVMFVEIAGYEVRAL